MKDEKDKGVGILGVGKEDIVVDLNGYDPVVFVTSKGRQDHISLFSNDQKYRVIVIKID